MRLFCASCEKDVSDNIAVYENVDGVLVHCGDCNFPLMFVGYDEPDWFGSLPKQSTEVANDIEEEEEVMSEEQLNLYDNDKKCDSCGCANACSPESFNEIDYDAEYGLDDTPAPSKLTFTTDDLLLLEKSLYSRHNRLRKSMDNNWDLLEKIQTLIGMREC